VLAFTVGCQEPSELAKMASRYEVHAIQTSTGPVLVRFDTATGQLEQAPLIGSRKWTPLGSAPGAQPGRRQAGRYALDYVQAPSIPLTFIRLDTRGGSVWRMGHSRDGEWSAFQPSGVSQSEPAAPRPNRRTTPKPSADTSVNPTGGFKQTKQDVDAFVQAVTSLDLPSDMRTWAVEQLGNGPSEHAVAPLLELLNDSDSAVVRSAIRSLARLDDPRVRPALERLKEHDTPEVRRVAMAALSKLR
jgi:hypothetical protein